MPGGLLSVQARVVLMVGGVVVVGMVTSEQQAPGAGDGGPAVAGPWRPLLRWPAAVLVPLVAIGLRASLAVVVTGVVGLGLAVAGGGGP